MTGHFFENKKSLPVKRHGFKGESIIAGSAPDSGFKALAAVMVDNILYQSGGELSYARPLFQSYCQRFSIALPRNIREFVRQRLLIAHHAGNLINELAFTLRQMLVDTLISAPLQYRTVLRNGFGFINEQTLRCVQTPLSPLIFAALAKALNARLLIRATEECKEIALRLRWGEADNSLISLYLQDGVYSFVTHHYHLFSQIDFNQPAAANWPTTPSHQDGVIEQKISEADAKGSKQYLTHVKRLYAMHQAQEISKDELMTLYIDSLRAHEAPVDLPAGVEFGSQHYFSHLLNGQAQSLNQLRTQAQTYDAKVVVELIFAVSRALTLGQLSEERVYNLFLENQTLTMP